MTKRSKVLVAAAVLTMLMVYANREMPPPAGLATPAFIRRTKRYCNIEGMVQEGKEGGVVGHTLIGVTVTVRHGDRSAVHAIPGVGMDAVYNCSGVDEESDIWPQGLRIVSEVSGAVLQRPVTSSTSGGGKVCTAGQLTQQGFGQLKSLGKYLKQAYASHPAVFTPQVMYARSTDYTRTLLSSAGFLSSFAEGGNQLDVRIHENEDDEIMHGVGMRSSSAGAYGFKSNSGEKVTLGGCARAVALSKAQKAVFRKTSHVRQELAALFGVQAADKDITDLGDAVHAGACHGLPLPCGQGGCLTAATAAEVLRSADKFYCERFTGGVGGKAAAKLAMYPFLRSISDGLQFVTDNQTAITTRLYFGHDTVIAPLLAALGVFDCKWPPYASRVVFELWRSTTSNNTVVRVVYNGLPQTLPGCSGQTLCPLPRFRRIINGLILPSGTLDEACERPI